MVGSLSFLFFVFLSRTKYVTRSTLKYVTKKASGNLNVITLTVYVFNIAWGLVASVRTVLDVMNVVIPIEMTFPFFLSEI